MTKEFSGWVVPMGMRVWHPMLNHPLDVVAWSSYQKNIHSHPIVEYHPYTWAHYGITVFVHDEKKGVWIIKILFSGKKKLKLIE